MNVRAPCGSELGRKGSSRNGASRASAMIWSAVCHISPDIAHPTPRLHLRRACMYQLLDFVWHDHRAFPPRLPCWFTRCHVAMLCALRVVFVCWVSSTALKAREERHLAILPSLPCWKCQFKVLLASGSAAARPVASTWTCRESNRSQRRQLLSRPAGWREINRGGSWVQI